MPQPAHPAKQQVTAPEASSEAVHGARDQFWELLPIQERVLGPEHPQTLFTRSNLADWTASAGDAAGARDQYAALLPIQERILGPEHPDTLTARKNLAGWTRQAETGSDRYSGLT